MPTKRTRRTRHARPAGLASITGLELLRWASNGPIIADTIRDSDVLEDAGYVIWPDWDTWADFYRQVRSEWLTQREDALQRRRESWERHPTLGKDRERFERPPACERLYRAWLQGGEDAAIAERKAIAAELAAEDPRRLLVKE